MHLASLSESRWRSEICIRFDRLAKELNFLKQYQNDTLTLIKSELLVVQIFFGKTKSCWVRFAGEDRAECYRTNKCLEERNWNEIERLFRLMAKQFYQETNVVKCKGMVK